MSLKYHILASSVIQIDETVQMDIVVADHA